MRRVPLCLPSHRTHAGIPGLPHKASSQTAGPHPQQAGGRERQEQASPGKGETHWKSQLGVSVSTVTRESLHVSQHSFTEIIHSTLRTVRPGCAGGPTGTREPPPSPSHRADGRQRSRCTTLQLARHTSPLELRAPPTPALCIQDPTSGTAAILRSNRANPKIPPTPPQASLPAWRHLVMTHPGSATRNNSRAYFPRQCHLPKQERGPRRRKLEPPNGPEALSGSSGSQGIRISRELFKVTMLRSNPRGLDPGGQGWPGHQCTPNGNHWLKETKVQAEVQSDLKSKQHRQVAATHHPSHGNQSLWKPPGPVQEQIRSLSHQREVRKARHFL